MVLCRTGLRLSSLSLPLLFEKICIFKSGSESEQSAASALYNSADDLSLTRLSPLQALPYVALLIVMLFFIYAVIGMQVSRPLPPRPPPSVVCSSLSSARPVSCPPGVLSSGAPVRSSSLFLHLLYSRCCQSLSLLLLLLVLILCCVPLFCLDCITDALILTFLGDLRASSFDDPAL